jgi:hypothetical protein
MIMDNFIISINTSLPVFIIVFLGIFLKRNGVIDENFISKANLIVFNISLPSLIFIKISSANFKSVFNSIEIIIACSATFICFLISWITADLSIKSGKTKGAFIQGSYRSNVAIIGLALANNLFGSSGVARGAILVSFLMPLYTVLSVLALTVPVHKNSSSKLGILKNIITNPLIIAVILAIPFSYFSIDFPVIFKQSVTLLSDITLPLALLSIGGSLNFKSMKEKFLPAFTASFIKLIAMPLPALVIAVYLGLRGESLGILFIILSTPTAVSSYIMARAMDSDDELAGHIVLITTLGAIVTVSGGIFILKSLRLI